MVTLVPFPGSLSTKISPCMASMSFFTMLMPRPVPSTLEMVEELTRSKGSKIRWRKEADMPMPLSWQTKTRGQVSVGASS